MKHPCISRGLWLALLWIGVLASHGADRENPLELPAPGYSRLRIITPSLLELTLVTTKAPNPARVAQWDFVNTNQEARLPAPSDFVVTAAGKTVRVESVGFKRRPIYAPLRQRDLRIENNLSDIQL